MKLKNEEDKYMKMTIRAKDGETWEGEHVATIPGHRAPTKDEIKKYFGAEPGTPQYKRLTRVAGYNRYILIVNGVYIAFPMNGAFKVNLH